MHPGHPITVDDVDSDRGKARIDALRTRIEKDRVVAYFRSPEELRTLVLDSLRRLETDRPLVLHPDTDIPRA